jgi:hypothetical protein
LAATYIYTPEEKNVFVNQNVVLVQLKQEFYQEGVQSGEHDLISQKTDKRVKRKRAKWKEVKGKEVKRKGEKVRQKKLEEIVCKT